MRRVDVAVVGAGPTGMAAALAAADSGAGTLLIDEHVQVGGQLRWRISPTLDADPGLGIEPGPGPLVAGQLAERLAERENLTVETGTVAWGLFEDNVLGISTETSADQVRAESVVLATGSTDITLPFPGWTLPGVMSARAVQIFLNIHRVLPGRQWAILGDGIEADEVSDDLERSGATVSARWPDTEGLRASGTNRLAHVECGDEIYEVDGLAIALGRQPDPELAMQAQAAIAFDWDLGGYTPLRDRDGLTSVPGIYVAGDAGGIGTLEELVLEGRLAGLAASGGGRETLAQARHDLDSASSQRRRQGVERIQRVASPG